MKKRKINGEDRSSRDSDWFCFVILSSMVNEIESKAVKKGKSVKRKKSFLFHMKCSDCEMVIVFGTNFFHHSLQFVVNVLPISLFFLFSRFPFNCPNCIVLPIKCHSWLKNYINTRERNMYESFRTCFVFALFVMTFNYWNVSFSSPGEQEKWCFNQIRIETCPITFCFGFISLHTRTQDWMDENEN